jgi:hypothetical protein
MLSGKAGKNKREMPIKATNRFTLPMAKLIILEAIKARVLDFLSILM